MTPDTFQSETSREILYVSFRAAWLTTFEALLSENEAEPGGLSAASPGVEATENASSTNAFPAAVLSHLPLLDGTAPQIQLECLFRTWHKLQNNEVVKPDLIDQAVCYCAIETLAIMSEYDRHADIRRALNGPNEIESPDLLWITSKVRSLQLTLPLRFPALRRFTDAGLLDAELDAEASGDYSFVERSALLNVVGDWRVSAQIIDHAESLLTPSEHHLLKNWLIAHPELMNL